jgi:hypothetical protein
MTPAVLADATIRVCGVASNGQRKPPRPRIELLAGGASDEESAAIVAALEQFLAETTPAPAAAEPSRWQRAALLEGISRDPGLLAWGRARR